MAGTTKTKPQGGKGPRKKKRINTKKVIFGVVIAVLLAIICAMGIYILVYMNGYKILNENIDKIETSKESTLIYANDGKNDIEVAKLYRGENRESVKISEVPDLLQKAFIATEDQRFESHSGVDFWAIGRALVKDVMHMSAVEGGSTITQQLAKNVFLSSEKTAFRKATEMSIAFALDQQYSKEEIMEKYLNRIFFGSNAYGIKAAAKVYFGKSDLNDLEIWEMATLAALPKAPSRYSPLAHPDLSKERRAVVLRLMTDQGYITEEQRAAAAAVDYVPPKTQGGSTQEYASFVDYVVNESEDMYGIEEEELLTKGYRIYTTMDPKTQKILEQTYANASFFQKDASDGVKIQSSMVIIDNKTGGLISMIGGRDYQSKGLNRIYSQRQPGSSFKPIAVYGPALETGDWNPNSLLDDTQTSFGSYSPRNFDRTTHGQVTMLEAVKKSYNLAPVWLLDQLSNSKGMSYVLNFIKGLGITSLDETKDRNLAIALGGLTNGASPLQMATAYTAFANEGMQNKPHAILKILDKNGTEVKTYKPEKKQVIKPQTAYYMTQLLQGVVETGGTGVKAKFNRPVAGKTGSTGLDIKGIEKYDRDVWFVGYTPEWTAAVWEGFDKTDSKHYVTVGSGSTAAIFKEVMSKALDGKPMTSFAKPKDLPEATATPTSVSDLAAVYVPERKEVKLTWTSLGDNTAYKVYRKDSKQTDYKLLIQSQTAEVTDTTVLAGETYQYYVAPFNLQTSSEGDKSNEANVQIPAEEESVTEPSSSPSASPDATPGKTKPGTSPSPSAAPGGKASSSPPPATGNKPGNKAGDDKDSGTGTSSGQSGASTSPTPSPSSKPASGQTDAGEKNADTSSGDVDIDLGDPGEIDLGGPGQD